MKILISTVLFFAVTLLTGCASTVGTYKHYAPATTYSKPKTSQHFHVVPSKPTPATYGVIATYEGPDYKLFFTNYEKTEICSASSEVLGILSTGESKTFCWTSIDTAKTILVIVGDKTTYFDMSELTFTEYFYERYPNN